MPVTNETSVASYQQCDGSNTSLLLRSTAYKPNDNVTLTAGFGWSTNFSDTNAFVLEGKAKYALNEHFSTQFRSRNSFSTTNTIFQGRLSVDCGTKVSDNVSIYVDPYVAAKYNCHKDKFTVDKGVFAGAKYKLDDHFTVCGEVQKYNGLEGGASNWGVNAILSYNF